MTSRLWKEVEREKRRDANGVAMQLNARRHVLPRQLEVELETGCVHLCQRVIWHRTAERQGTHGERRPLLGRSSASTALAHAGSLRITGDTGDERGWIDLGARALGFERSVRPWRLRRGVIPTSECTREKKPKRESRSSPVH